MHGIKQQQSDKSSKEGLAAATGSGDYRNRQLWFGRLQDQAATESGVRKPGRNILFKNFERIVPNLILTSLIVNQVIHHITSPHQLYECLLSQGSVIDMLPFFEFFYFLTTFTFPSHPYIFCQQHNLKYKDVLINALDK